MYVNPEFSAAANGEAAKETDATQAVRMRFVGQQPTAVWLDRIAAVPSLRTHLDQTIAQGANLFLGVLYDLPERNCAALASNGEITGSMAGLARYEAQFIVAIAAIASDPKYAGVRIVFVVEPNSLPNLVTSLSVQRCAEMNAPQSGAPAGIYVEGVRYAVNKLHAIPNVYLYVDAANSAWLGWPENLARWVSLMGNVAQGFTAGKSAIDRIWSISPPGTM